MSSDMVLHVELLSSDDVRQKDLTCSDLPVVEVSEEEEDCA